VTSPADLQPDGGEKLSVIDGGSGHIGHEQANAEGIDAESDLRCQGKEDPDRANIDEDPKGRRGPDGRPA
jgi:hypothetical protein